jgi:hypothetical protein
MWQLIPCDDASKVAAQSDVMPAAYFGGIPQDSIVLPSHRWHLLGDPDCRGDCIETLGIGSIDGIFWNIEIPGPSHSKMLAYITVQIRDEKHC